MTVRASVNDVGTTSLEVGVRVESEDLDHGRAHAHVERLPRVRGARRRRQAAAGPAAPRRDRGRSSDVSGRRRSAARRGSPQASAACGRRATDRPLRRTASGRMDDGPTDDRVLGARRATGWRPRDGAVDLYRLAGSPTGHRRRGLPHTVKILLENLLRRAGTRDVSDDDVRALAGWPRVARPRDLAFMPARVLMQDFTGVPAVVDLAAMRSAMARAGGDPSQVNPLVAVDLIIDHSVQVDLFRTPEAYEANIEWEYRRNGERYALLRWAQQAFDGVRVVPPGAGICHQVNLEHLGRVVTVRDGVALPDTLVGTDSHTTMINGLGVLGWGVGGIEAEAAMLGQPMFLPTPSVVGVRVLGALPPGTTATDLVLTLTQMLRAHGVVGKFVEFFGDGLLDARARGSGDAVEHVPRVRGDRRVLPGGRRDAALPGAHRPGRPRRPRRALHEGAGPVPSRRRPRAGVHRDRSSSTSPRSSRRSPARSGRRTACRCPASGPRSSRRSATGSSPIPRRPRSGVCSGRGEAPRSPSIATQTVEPGAEEPVPLDHGVDPARLGRDRRDHQLHEHVEPVGDARRRAAREEGGRGGPGDQAVGEDLARARARAW